MLKIISRLRINSLRIKLILLYFITIFIPFVIISQIVLNISGEQILSQTIENTQQASRQVSSNVKELLVQYNDIINRIYYDEILKSYLNPTLVYSDVLQSMDAYDKYLKIMPYYDFSVKFNGADLKIYFLNKTLLQDYDTYVFADEKIKNTEAYKKAQEANGLLTCTFSSDSVFLSRMLIDTDNNEMGVVSLRIPEDKFYSLISENNINDKRIIISSMDGEVFSSNDRQLVGTSIKDKSYYTGIIQNDSGIIDNKQKGDYRVVYETINNGNNSIKWKVISIIPIDKLLSKGRKVKNIGFIICSLSLLISCIIYIFSLDRIIKRIKILVDNMKGVKEGKFLTIKNNEVNDEIGQLTINFNLMVEGLNQLIHENYEVNLKMKDIAIKKKEAELYALQSQVNPHFLFNTLESIRMGLQNKEDTETADVIFHLSKIFRKSLNWQGDIITLSEEIEFVRNYLEIQKYRFKNKINYEIDIPESFLCYTIPKLIIQPIVENAIKHGIERKWGNGNVIISAAIQDNKLSISVKDDGVGIDEESLTKIRNELYEINEVKKTGSIGLRNVNNRIILHCGTDFGLKISSEKNIGTTVILELQIML
jgi:Putative regulator of cell autolysis